MFIYFNERLSSQHCECIFAVLHSMSQQQSSSDSYIELHSGTPMSDQCFQKLVTYFRTTKRNYEATDTVRIYSLNWRWCGWSAKYLWHK